MRRKPARVALLVLASTLAWIVPTVADAAPSPRRATIGGGEGFHQTGFIYGSPGVLAIPIDENDTFDLDPTWQWSAGGGYMFTPTRLFKATVGGAFEHTVYNPDFDPIDGSMLRFVPEARIGAGNNRVWGYGLLGMGLALSIVDYDNRFDDEDADAGFDLQLGGGVQGMVWRNLMLGGELDFDLAFFHDDECDRCPDDDYSIHTLGIKFIIGWYF